MDHKDLKTMTLDELRAEFERVRNERWAIRKSNNFNFALDSRYIAVRHAISKIERLNTNITQST